MKKYADLAVHFARSSDGVWKANGRTVRFGRLHNKPNLDHFIIGPFLISWTWFE